MNNKGKLPMDHDTITILLTCLNYTGDSAKKEHLECISADKWGMVVDLAKVHGVTPLVYHRLKQMNIALPNKVTKRLKQEYLINAARNMQLFQELGNLLRRMQEQDIGMIGLKGIHLAAEVYDNTALRTMGDIDLLVKKEYLLPVEQTLLMSGYKPENPNRIISEDNAHFAYKLPKHRTYMEIHWVLTSSNHPVQIAVDELWNRAGIVKLPQVPMLGLSPADLLLYLCLHTTQHLYEMRIRMLCDIGEVVRHYDAELDWQEIGARARLWGITRAVYVILRLTVELLKAAVPTDWLASIKPAGFEDRYLTLAHHQVAANQAEDKISKSVKSVQFWEAAGLAGKLAIISESLLLSRETMATRYPAPANSWRIYLYYPVRFKDALLRNCAALWRFKGGGQKTKVLSDHISQMSSLRDWMLSG